MNGYEVRVDNRLKAFGETDDATRITKINVAASKEYGRHHKDWATKGGAVANTIQHEIIHQKHNAMSETDVRKETAERMATMGRREKNKLYTLIKK